MYRPYFSYLCLFLYCAVWYVHRRRKIKNRHRKFSEGLKSLFGFGSSTSKSSGGGDRVVRKRYKNSNSGVSYAYTYRRSSSPKKLIEYDDNESTNSNEEKVIYMCIYVCIYSLFI